MCGIAGYVGGGTREQLSLMVDGVKHRGPDDMGVLVRRGVGLGHARLSIIDTSAAGHQPMSTSDGTVAIVFNGEIYNFLDLRKELEKEGHHFASSSDTEVILALYKKYGIACFEKLAGMFAIGLYDFSNSSLLLVRDRMGEKPLYWTFQDGTLFFASELGALLQSGSVKKEIDLSALNQYLLFDYVPTPKSIIKDVFKLEPATALTYRKGKITKHRFWNPPARLREVSAADAQKGLDAMLKKIVERELIADVPLGIFLSGGIDSSAIAYYAQYARGGAQIDTFSIGFDDPSFDESSFAREVAKHLGTNHHEMMLRADDALSLVPVICSVLSEPVADASILPTLLLSQFARKSVTVVLGGDGGDELFAGYPTFTAEHAHSFYKRLPHIARRAIKRAAGMLPVSHADFSWSYRAKKFVSSEQERDVHRHMEWLGTFQDEWRDKLSTQMSNFSKYNGDLFGMADKYSQDYKPDDAGNRLLYMYARTYLMDQVLVKVDRASMHYALEVRAPFLDHAIADYMLSLPHSFKYRRGTTKFLLKKLMEDKLPAHIVNRKKKGFGIPLTRWLAGPLKNLCTDILSKQNLSKHGLFNPDAVHGLIDDHMKREKDNRKELWNLIVFQLWYDRWML